MVAVGFNPTATFMFTMGHVVDGNHLSSELRSFGFGRSIGRPRDARGRGCGINDGVSQPQPLPEQIINQHGVTVRHDAGAKFACVDFCDLGTEKQDAS